MAEADGSGVGRKRWPIFSPLAPLFFCATAARVTAVDLNLNQP
jgi:hypothetical protein